MLKGHSILGKRVLSRMDGQRLDSVNDIVISKDHSRVLALILDQGGLFSPATAVAIENVVSFGKDAVVITDSKTVVRVDHFPAVKEVLDDRDSLVGKKVFSEAGDGVGKVEDIYFDETNGSIVALEVVGKFAPQGRSSAVQLALGDVVSIGPDAVIINMAAMPKLEAQVGGSGDKQPAPDQRPVESAPPLTTGPLLQAGEIVPDLTAASTPPMAGDIAIPTPRPLSAPLPPNDRNNDEEPGVAYGKVNDPTGG